MGQPLYFRKNSKGLPVLGSNMKANKKPTASHTQITNVINSPLPDSFKPRFAGTTQRYFIQFNSTTGELISNSLIQSTNVPEGYYLELFSNNLVTTPLGSNQNSGVRFDSLEDLADVPVILSQDFLTNGYRRTVIVN